MPLHEAAWRGLSEVIQLLLGLNAPAHPRTLEGETPLMLAQRKGFQDCVEILRKKIKKKEKSHLLLLLFFLIDREISLQVNTKLRNRYFPNTIGITVH